MNLRPGSDATRTAASAVPPGGGGAARGPRAGDGPPSVPRRRARRNRSPTAWSVPPPSHPPHLRWRPPENVTTHASGVVVHAGVARARPAPCAGARGGRRRNGRGCGSGGARHAQRGGWVVVRGRRRGEGRCRQGHCSRLASLRAEGRGKRPPAKAGGPPVTSRPPLCRPHCLASSAPLPRRRGRGYAPARRRRVTPPGGPGGPPLLRQPSTPPPPRATAPPCGRRPPAAGPRTRAA
jgi:hypothetical protein